MSILICGKHVSITIETKSVPMHQLIRCVTPFITPNYTVKSIGTWSNNTIIVVIHNEELLVSIQNKASGIALVDDVTPATVVPLGSPDRNI
jgi:hypothetical protein